MMNFKSADHELARSFLYLYDHITMYGIFICVLCNDDGCKARKFSRIYESGLTRYEAVVVTFGPIKQKINRNNRKKDNNHEFDTIFSPLS